MSRRRFLSLFILIASAVSGVLIADYIGAVFAMTVIGMFCCSFLLLPFSLFGLTAFSGQSAGCAARRECRFAGTSYTKGLLSVRQRQNHLLFTESFYRSFLQRERDRAAGKGKSTLALPVHAPHAGNTEISVTRVWFYDLTGLLCIPRKVKGAASFCALPQIETARVRSVLPQEAEDSGEADPNRPGHSRPGAVWRS